MSKRCDECLYLIDEDDESCKKAIFRESTNATGNCQFFFHREKDSANTQKMEIDERTMLCFDGVSTWLEQTRTIIENDVLIEETIDVRLEEEAIKKTIQVLTFISDQLVKKRNKK